LKERIALAADTVSPRQAREWISTRCGINPDTIFVATLLVSEIVSNAVIHAGSEMILTLDRDRMGVHVEVEDHGTGQPVAPDPAAPVPDGPSGRGLKIVSELASAWGVRSTRDGKAVWFDLTLN
jgi:anti-sigma regulatory factor (Ser/Thr protein kinase)